MAEKEYIEREAVNALIKAECSPKVATYLIDAVATIPAADVLPRDEAITMGAELAAMHGSDATSQQLEEAYLKGVEYGMTRRDVRPVVRGAWKETLFGWECTACGEEQQYARRLKYCPNCGADMREES